MIIVPLFAVIFLWRRKKACCLSATDPFHESAFEPWNKGTIIWKGVTIWDNGWTKEGAAMDERGEIPTTMTA